MEKEKRRSSTVQAWTQATHEQAYIQHMTLAVIFGTDYGMT
jgi:hypothetical protein